METEYLLAPHEWPPALPAVHREFLAQTLPTLCADPQREGVAASGSFISGVMDERLRSVVPIVLN